MHDLLELNQSTKCKFNANQILFVSLTEKRKNSYVIADNLPRACHVIESSNSLIGVIGFLPKKVLRNMYNVEV